MQVNLKAECLKGMDRVKKTRRRMIITKHKIPVAQLTPIEKKKINLFGAMKGTVHFKGNIIEPIGEKFF
jgi:antitoxin (DNA-binding transcriptional repressor) of toxin-antitoxin stability system